METKRCNGCMKLKTQSPVCEWCGYDENTQNDIHQLPVGTVLKEQYRVGRTLGQGGFGITYLGWDLYLDIPVAIKEYYPSGVVMRDSTVTMDVVSWSGDEGARFRNNKERFLREAKMLARFSQVPEIVQVKNFFLANNTAYIVMEYVEGITLKEYVQMHGGKLGVQQTLEILRPVMEALCKVHRTGLVHRDISPDNIMMLPNGGVKLLDFGAVRDVGAAAADKPLTKSTEAILKQGYAPIEQYQKRGGLGPWTDVYAMCATIYFCLTGQVPPDAPERLLGYEELNLDKTVPELTPPQEKALEHGMELRAEERTASMEHLLQELFGNAEVPQFAVDERIGIAVLPREREIADGERAGRAVEDAHAAETDLTEIIFQVNQGFTTEHTIAVRIKRAVVRVKTVFEDETNLHAVAEVFRTLDAEAATRVVTGGHLERRFVVNRNTVELIVNINVLINETRVDTTVDLDVSSHGGTGEGAEGGDSNQRLLEHVNTFYVSLICGMGSDGNGMVRRTPHPSRPPFTRLPSGKGLLCRSDEGIFS